MLGFVILDLVSSGVSGLGTLSELHPQYCI